MTKNLPAISTRATPRQGTSRVSRQLAEPLGRDHPLLDFAPYIHKAPRANSITPTRQRRFVAELAATGIVSHAARKIGVSMEALYKLRHKPGAEGFRAAWDAAVDMGVDRLEATALARALEGEERMVVSSGQVLGTERRHNEALVMFLMRQRRADRYGTEIRPGHPLYERIKREVLADAAPTQEDEDAVLASLTAKLNKMHERQQYWLRDHLEKGTLPPDICPACAAKLPAPMVLTPSN